MPDEWQAHLIQRVLQGYDSIFCAGTGYGKSLIFEGIAALGGRGKVAIVISPLKALQKDQVNLLQEFDGLCYSLINRQLKPRQKA
jgi:superfamily II DNA helicase RecQ